MHTTTETAICGSKRNHHTCNLVPHTPAIDHAETALTPSGFPYVVAYWNDGTGPTGLDQLIVTDQIAREAHAEVVLSEDAPTSADCASCGASHVFDTIADAEEWQADHGDLGHRVEITSI